MRHPLTAAPLLTLALAACAEPAVGDGPQDATCQHDGVPRPPMRRLTHTELDHAVRDLFGVDLRPSTRLPVEAPGEGFRNDATHQSLSPLWVERLGEAARWVADTVLAPFQHTVRIEAEDVEPDLGQIVTLSESDGTWHYFDVDHSFTRSFDLPLAATWSVQVRAASLPWDHIPPYFSEHKPLVRVFVDDVQLEQFIIASTDLGGPLFEVAAPLAAGQHELRVEIDVSDLHRVFVDHVSVVGPLEPALAETDARTRLLTCEPGRSCAARILEPLATRAWRRPLAAEEVDALADLVADALGAGDTWEDALALGLEVVLTAPSFLFVVEDEGIGALGPWERAARLALFLWSSLPDDELMDCAATGGLGDDDGACGLTHQVARMLADPRADALVDGFVAEWLGLDDLNRLERDATLFPGFDAELGRSMSAETRAVAAELFARDADLARLLDADFTFLDDRLAAHYGLPAPGSEALVLTPLADRHRMGVLRHGSVLSATSHPSGHSFVLRGVYLLRQLLCDPPEQPPADVPALEEGQSPSDALQQHSDDPRCSGCHGPIDALGRSLDAYDAVGVHHAGWTSDGIAPDGVPLPDADALVDWLQVPGRADACLTRHLTSWALARTLGDDAQCTVDAIADDSAHTLSSLALAIVRSTPFLTRTEEAE